MKLNTNNYFCPICGSVPHGVLGRYYGTVFPFNNKNNKLLRCHKCGLVHLNPMPSEIELNKFYTQYWTSKTAIQSAGDESLKLYKAENSSRLSFLLKNIGSLENKAVLDFGAGHGLFGEILIEGEHNAKYYAVEADEEIVEYLKAKDFNASGDIDSLKQKSFDIIVAFHVLEHWPNPINFLNNLTKYLKKDGYLFLEIPNQDYLWKKHFEPHVLFFNAKSLDILLKRLFHNNFEIMSYGRCLKIIPKERTIKRILRHQIGEILRTLGLRPYMSKERNLIDEETIREMYEMNKFGPNRQWLRALIKKTG